jgi:hypothetical protein
MWEEGPGLPLPGGEGLEGSCAVAISSTTFLLIGGIRYSGSTFLGSSSAVNEFSSLTGAWTQWPVGLSVPRKSHACSSFQGKVVVAGGYNGDYLDSTEILDPVTREVKLAGPMSTPRQSFGMYEIGYAGWGLSRALLTFGSASSGSTATLEESLLTEWDPWDQVWRAAPVVLARRAGFTAVTVEARHVCLQGELLTYFLV